MEAQGYATKDNIVYQDNKSTILLANKKEYSSGNRPKIVTSDISFVTDRLTRKEISMEYFLKADMYGDFYTNTIQGGLYDTNDYVPEG